MKIEKKSALLLPVKEYLYLMGRTTTVGSAVLLFFQPLNTLREKGCCRGVSSSLLVIPVKIDMGALLKEEKKAIFQKMMFFLLLVNDQKIGISF